MKKKLFFIFMIFTMALYGRNYTELQEWREKKLPGTMSRGVQIEIYDFESIQGVKYEYPSINIRVHNRGNSVVEELIVSIWFWKKEGVYVKELFLVGDGGGYQRRLYSGEERYFPSKKRYYNFKNLKFEDVTNLDIKISKLRTR